MMDLNPPDVSDEADFQNTVRLLRSIVDVGMFSLDLKTGELRCDVGFLQLWGLDEREGPFRYADLLASVHPDDRARCTEDRELALMHHQPYHSYYRVVRSDGSVRHIRSEGGFIFDARGNPTRNVGAAIDVTQKVTADRKFLHLLEHDRLTDLVGRNAFIERLQRAVLHHQTDEIFGVVVFDIDRFTALNDTIGSSSGDIVLRAFAARLTMLEHDGHIVGRIGGDEFACLFRGYRDEPQLVAAVEGAQTMLREPIPIAGASLRVSASCGLAVFPGDGEDIRLLERAHLACCHAKANSDNRFSRYEASLEADVSKQYALESALHNAIANEEFEVRYQPIVSSATLEITGVEALVRWRHPQLGLVTPGAFLPTAQFMGILPQIDAWVLARACTDAVRLSERAGHRIELHVNVSASALASPNFVNVVRAALESSGLPSECLALEITEQSLIVDEIGAAERFAAIRSIGVKIVVDDFGTAYNGLRYLKTYTIDGIKIDRAFVHDLETSKFGRALCSGITALAHNLDLEVGAEGVETIGQANFLKTLGVHELQGFFYGKPVKVRTLLARWTKPAAA